MRGVALLILVVSGVAAAPSVAQLAPGQAIERVRVSAVPTLPQSLFVIVGSPPAYARQTARGTSGSWIGPPYWAQDNPSARNSAAIDWEVRFDNRAGTTEQIALANLTRDWTEDQRAGVSVPHLVGGRMVGTIPGFFVLQIERRSAPGELAVAFPVARQLHAVVRFLLLRPENDSFYVNGNILASSWNRGQALLAMSRVKLEGNLPPSLVSIRQRQKGRLIAGFVLDTLRHAVVGVPVALERRTGRGWRRIATTRSSRLGGYTFRVRPGSYRTSATLAGRFRARSRAIRVRAVRSR